jgi:hypothetical protein
MFDRYLEAAKQFSAPRFAVLEKVWRLHGDDVIWNTYSKGTTSSKIRRLERPSEFGHFRPVEDGFDDGEALRRGVVRDQHGLTGRIEGGAAHLSAGGVATISSSTSCP